MNTDTVTADRLKALDPALTNDMSNDVLNALISKATLVAESDGFPDTVTVNGRDIPVLKEAIEDMALHLCFINGNAGRGITSVKVDALEEHFADITQKGWLGSSKWGQLYLWLYKRWGSGNVPRVAVIEH